MRIEYGPPGAVGVKQLAYMGEVPGGPSLMAIAALGTAGYALTRKGEARRDFLVAAGAMWIASMVL
jgi:hypothetical protein